MDSFMEKLGSQLLGEYGEALWLQTVQFWSASWKES